MRQFETAGEEGWLCGIPPGVEWASDGRTCSQKWDYLARFQAVTDAAIRWFGHSVLFPFQRIEREMEQFVGPIGDAKGVRRDTFGITDNANIKDYRNGLLLLPQLF